MIDIEYKTLKECSFIDLFAGIGGFHYALKLFVATCVFASEIDKEASRVYELNHMLKPKGDITKNKRTRYTKTRHFMWWFPLPGFFYLW